MGNLTAFDIIVLLLVGGGAVLGFMRGLVQEVLTLLAWVLAIAAVRLFHAPVSDLLADKVGTAGGSAVLGFVLIFGIVFALGKWLSHSIGQRSRTSFVGAFDRGLGAGFGAVKGLLLATLLFMGASLLYDIGYGDDAAPPQWMADSRTYPALSATSAAASSVIAARRAAAHQGGADRSASSAP